jgi:hypothetical protein
MSPVNQAPPEDTATPSGGLLGHFARLFLKERLELLKLSLKIILRPAEVGSKLQNSAAGALRTTKHFLEMFAIAFLVFALANSLNFSAGESEWRLLVTTIVEVLFGTAIIYLLSRTLRDRPPALIMIQAALLFVGTYLITQAIVSIPIRYVELAINLPNINRELDVFSTEFERCLAEKSYAYWLLRGDLEFFLYSDRWKPEDWLNWFFDNYRYFIVLPFLLIFASLLSVKRISSYLWVCVFTLFAFVVTVELSGYSRKKAGQALANATPECSKLNIERVIGKYNPDLIAKHIVYKINNESKKARGFDVPIFLDGRDFVMALQVRPEAAVDWQLTARIPSIFRESYCSEYLFWSAARRIEYNLLIVMYDSNKMLLHRQRVTNKDC